MEEEERRRLSPLTSSGHNTDMEEQMVQRAMTESLLDSISVLCPLEVNGESLLLSSSSTSESELQLPWS